MHTQPCFIRKYSKELCEKLEKLGLEIINSDDTTLDGHNYDGKGNHHKIEEGKAIITYCSSNYGVIYDIDYTIKSDRFDCETNEELFLALASLRDDNDYMQIFICGNDFVLCEYNNWNDMCSVLYNENKYTMEVLNNAHKATAKDLILFYKYNYK